MPNTNISNSALETPATSGADPKTPARVGTNVLTTPARSVTRSFTRSVTRSVTRSNMSSKKEQEPAHRIPLGTLAPGTLAPGNLAVSSRTSNNVAFGSTYNQSDEDSRNENSMNDSEKRDEMHKQARQKANDQTVERRKAYEELAEKKLLAQTYFQAYRNMKNSRDSLRNAKGSDVNLQKHLEKRDKARAAYGVAAGATPKDLMFTTTKELNAFLEDVDTRLGTLQGEMATMKDSLKALGEAVQAHEEDLEQKSEMIASNKEEIRRLWEAKKRFCTIM